MTEAPRMVGWMFRSEPLDFPAAVRVAATM